MNIRFLKFILLVVTIIAINACQKQSKPHLTKTEKEWVDKNPVITLAVDDTYPPLNYRNDNGVLTGLNVELVRLIEKKLPIEIKLIGSDWDVALKKAMSHEVDGIINATPLPERGKQLLFTKPFFNDPMALITNKSGAELSDIESLTNKTIAVKKNSRHLHYIEENAPDAIIYEINTLPEGINLLAKQEVDGVFDDLAPLYHLISSLNLNNIKVAFVEISQQGASIGIRKNAPLLLSILNKAIDSISEKEKLNIQNKWLQFVPERDYSKYYLAIGILLAVLLIIGLWNWSLRVVVKKRTNELKQELAFRKETEEELLKAKEKAEESDKLKTAFLANISHEIRTPMNGILGFVQLLNIPDIDSNEKENYLKLIEQSGNRMLDIMTDLINISLIESGEIEVKPQEVEVYPLMKELHERFRQAAKNKGINFTIDIPKTLENCTLKTDENKLNQILLQLIKNAIKFTNQGKVVFGIKPSQKFCEIYVKDTGTGIAPEIKDLIFDAFRQGDLRIANPTEGFGIGLAISKAYTKALNGQISFSSEVGKGSEFIITLPFE